MKNLKSLASMVESCNDEFLKFDLEYEQVLSLTTCMYLACIVWYLLMYDSLLSIDRGPSGKGS